MQAGDIMGHIYFIRHGETVWNVENKVCGSTDTPLTGKTIIPQTLATDPDTGMYVQRSVHS